MTTGMRKLAAWLPLVVVLSFVGGTARTDEGMWTFNDFPKDKVKPYGFTPDDKWLTHVRSAAIRIAGGCSGSFVSPEGLVMTNHHCVHECVQNLSTADKDFVKAGFFAKTLADEPKCPAMEIDALIDISNVTDRLGKATAGLTDAKYIDALKAETAKIEKECAPDASLRCEVVSLWQGGRYDLYKYKRYQDVRLVMAPEFDAAFFGGDPENFMFPRFDLDMGFARVYENDKPAKTPDYFPFSPAGPKDGDLTFVPGNPGGTDRGLTTAELEFERDVYLPLGIERLSELRGAISEFQHRGDEARRISTDELFSIENRLKAYKGRVEALRDKDFFAAHDAQERAFRDRIAKDAALQKNYGGAWDAIAKAMVRKKQIYLRYATLERGRGFECDLFAIARKLVRGADERPKANEKRLEEYTDAALPELTADLFSTAPIDDDFEIMRLSHALTKLRENLGARDPLVKKVLGKDTPDEVATRLVKGTKLKDLAVRKQLWDGGKKAVAASTDPMIVFAKLVDADSRAVRKVSDDEVDAVEKKNSELINHARFELEGTSNYPDATFTLRLSYGTVTGYEENGAQVKPFTNFAGGFDLATGKFPYALPDSWYAAKKSGKLKLTTPLNFVTSNDIIGGNSGSPVINKDAQIVGLVFDGNIQSLGGEYFFDPKVNRTVAVDSAAIMEALRHIYAADRLADELSAKK